MRLFGRRRPLHEELAERGGLGTQRTQAGEPDPFVAEPAFPSPVTREPAISGLARQREWDAVVTAEAPELAGDRVAFVALPDGSLLVEEEQGDAQLDPLASAVEGELRPPYRARAVRQSASVWAVFANRIRVERFEAPGEHLELAVTEEGKSFRVDDSPSFGSVRELERIGAAEGETYAVRATRLDGDLWEVRAGRL